MKLFNKLEELSYLIGNTPIYKITDAAPCNLYAKLEYKNYMGNVKARPAFYILNDAISKGLIDQETTIVESTSGNFGLALAGICKKIRLKFIPVIDPNITSEKEAILKLLSHKIIKVNEKDETGGYLITRINAVQRFLLENTRSYNPNQYENENNYQAYYHTLGEEICNSFSRLDYVFVSVSSGGTITGLSLRLKEKFKNIKVIGVDLEGSVIFNNKPKARKISGIGASIRTPIIENALIDDVIILSQLDVVRGCYQLLEEQAIFGGGSSGAAYFAAKQYLKNCNDIGVNALFICSDKGNAYIDNIYNNEWVKKHLCAENLELI